MKKSSFDQLSVAVAGAGLMGYWHAYYARRLGASIISIADPNAGTAERIAKQFGHVKVYANIETMLAQEKPDVLHVCTPLESHYDIISTALENKIHVLAEKPLTDTAENTERLVALARKKSALLAPVHQFAFQRGISEIMKHPGDFGAARHLQFNFCSAGGEGKSQDQLNSIVADIVPHVFSIIQKLWPREKIEKHDWAVKWGVIGELSVQGEIDGTSISIYISMNSRPTRCEMRMYCETGTYDTNFFHGYTIKRSGGVSRAKKIIQPFIFGSQTVLVSTSNLVKRMLGRELAYPGLSALVRDFYNAIIADAQSPISLDDALSNAKVRDHIIARI